MEEERKRKREDEDEDARKRPRDGRHSFSHSHSHTPSYSSHRDRGDWGGRREDRHTSSSSSGSYKGNGQSYHSSYERRNSYSSFSSHSNPPRSTYGVISRVTPERRNPPPLHPTKDFPVDNLDFDSDPHLKQLFLQRKSTVEVVRYEDRDKVGGWSRVLASDSPREVYRVIPHHQRSVNHWGQRKLMLSEVRRESGVKGG